MPRKTARIVNPHFHALPNELQMLVFRKYLNTGDEDVCMLVRAQKNAMTLRLVCKPLAEIYQEPVSRCAVYAHMQKRKTAREEEKDSSRKMINSSIETIDSNVLHIYEAMAVKNGKAAFVGLKKIKKMHAAQNKNFARAGFPLH